MSKKNTTSILVDTTQPSFDTAKFVVDTIGKDNAYNLATCILEVLQDKKYCIWQTYTMNDLKQNTGKKRITEEQWEDFKYALTNFASIDPLA